MSIPPSSSYTTPNKPPSMSIKYKRTNNYNFIKLFLPFASICIVGTYILSKFLDEKYLLLDKKKNSKSMLQYNNEQLELENELLRIQNTVSKDWTQVPIPGSRDDPNGQKIKKIVDSSPIKPI